MKLYKMRASYKILDSPGSFFRLSETVNPTGPLGSNHRPPKYQKLKTASEDAGLGRHRCEYTWGGGLRFQVAWNLLSKVAQGVDTVPNAHSHTLRLTGRPVSSALEFVGHMEDRQENVI